MIAPRDRSSAVSDEIRESAARGLNEPVFWRCSALRYNAPVGERRRPIAASTNRAAVADDSIGVWWMRPSRRSRIASIAARVTVVSVMSASMRLPRPRRHLRSCAISERLGYVIVTQPTTEADRQRSAAVARALGDPKRLCVLESLADGEASVGELASRVSCQVPNMSQHLAVLRSAGLVATRRDGNTVYYSLTDPRVIEAYQLLQAIAR